MLHFLGSLDQLSELLASVEHAGLQGGGRDAEDQRAVLLWVAQSKTEDEKRLLLELARTWTAAAFASDRIVAVSGSAPEARVS